MSSHEKPVHEAEALILSALRHANLSDGTATLTDDELMVMREFLFNLSHQAAALRLLVHAIDKSSDDDDEDDHLLELALRVARAAIDRATGEDSHE